MRKFFFILAASTALALLYDSEARAVSLDTNGDGKVTRAEFDAARRHDYRLLDRNRNKAISRTEFYKRGDAADRQTRRQRSRRFREIDVDDDGGISPREYLNFGRRQFRRLDRNRDGILSGIELSPAKAKLASASKASPGQGRRDVALAQRLNRISPASRKAKPKKSIKIKQIAQKSDAFSKMDRNKDGVISRSEFRRALRTHYRILDTYPNKAISRREYYRLKAKPPKAELLQRRRDYRRMDKDDDGGLSREEYVAYAPTFFRRLDANRDRKLDRAELAGRFGVAAAPVRRRDAATGPAKDTGRKFSARAKTDGDEARRSTPDSGTKSSATKSSATQDSGVGTTAKPAIPESVKQAFAKIDKNKDGSISERELSDARLQRFNQYDRNLDWGLSRREFVRDRPNMLARFKQMDTDGNGKISWKEYSRAGDARFKSVDKNGDRKISLAEFAGQE